MAHITLLPTELLLAICEVLPTSGINVLHRTCRTLNLRLTPTLFSRASNTIVAGYTGIHWAAKCGNLALAKHLLARGAYVCSRFPDGTVMTTRSDDGRLLTSLHLSAFYNTLEMARFLIDLGADVNERCIEFRTALHRAAAQGHTEMVLLLLEHGADVAAVSKGGWTPLHAACMAGHMGVARVLLHHRAPVVVESSGQSVPAAFLSARQRAMFVYWWAKGWLQGRRGRQDSVGQGPPLGHDTARRKPLL
ncbi:ankyrin repeat-containing domain protein [Sphaerosporella brunnea]|uniref:Ankyrin repeat-containing domain protein n=1 Tax=Sphaerosporella brunnea TaxID=1250544 RepID=A0A5J5ELT0_9PEZI|nr:ankyrin repeat-containing domain protein [Sphaerosporella brunnea]